MTKTDFNSGKMYALLVAIGDYHQMELVELPTFQTDLALIGTALEKGLMVNPEHVRVLGVSGKVYAREFALSIKNFETMLSKEDSFLFYFSGHGRNDELVFSDMSLKTHSVLAYIDKLVCKNKIVILDCCYSGDFALNGPKQMNFEDTVNAFAGAGIAIMASSAPDQESRLGVGKNHSLYSGIVGTAMMSKKSIRKGLLSLNDINAEVFAMINTWNKQNPDKVQNPIFRCCMGGTVYFKVADYRPYVQKKVYMETERYTIYEVKPLSTLNIKRLAAFVILKKKESLLELARITKEIAKRIKRENVYSSERSEKRFWRKPARAVWCYFGLDEGDMIQHRYLGYTIWAADAEMRKTYYRENGKASIVDGIYIFQNSSYEMIKKIQTRSVTREEFLTQNQQFLSKFVTMAERFIYDLREVDNKIIELETLRVKYKEWIRTVQKKYIELSDVDVAPDDLYEWANEIQNLAGCILDISLQIENEIGSREMWLINHSVSRYNQSLERLKEIEKGIE